MKTVFLTMAAGAVLTLALFGELRAAPEDVAVGDVRATLARSGTVARGRASALGPPQATLPHGTRVRVDEVQGRWIRVTPLGGVAGGRGGWVKASATVEPFALTMGGQAGTSGAAAARRGPTSTEISAAGRQFDSATEDGYRTSSADLSRAYPLVDRVEESQPDAAAVERFILEGRLGRPEGAR